MERTIRIIQDRIENLRLESEIPYQGEETYGKIESAIHELEELKHELKDKQNPQLPKVYETNSGLAYNEYAFLIKVDENQYLCIYTNFEGEYESWDDAPYVIGRTYSFEWEDIELNESKYSIEDSPLYNTFLFQNFIKNR